MSKDKKSNESRDAGRQDGAADKKAGLTPANGKGSDREYKKGYEEGYNRDRRN